ncbi:hypothetical protein ACGC1H_003167 [Rhizoctonia solani]|uniref:Uncharacterized protein n=1 Tax=Rhizoctonia solani TaxID=456999 RepID=A0A8H2X2L6_9AGAM|nr:unnamed protein product [Rhizoctonia solani]
MIPLLLLACAPGAFAAYNCGYDFYGRYRCSGLSNAARLGIGIGIAALTILAFSLIIMLRRRRLRQANEAYIHNPNQAPYPPQHYQHYPPQQYPTQPSYDPSNQWSNSYYNTQQGGWNAGAPMGAHPDNQSQPYAPPPGAPPSYTPPAHPPPTKEHV